MVARLLLSITKTLSPRSEKNSTATYTNSVVAGVPDSVALVMLPGSSGNCTTYRALKIRFHLWAFHRRSGWRGRPSSVLDNSIVDARNVHGLSMLFYGAYQPIRLTGAGTKLHFEDISLDSIFYGRDMQNYAIGAESTTINAELHTRLPSSSLLLLLQQQWQRHLLRRFSTSLDVPFEASKLYSCRVCLMILIRSNRSLQCQPFGIGMQRLEQ